MISNLKEREANQMTEDAQYYVDKLYDYDFKLSDLNEPPDTKFSTAFPNPNIARMMPLPTFQEQDVSEGTSIETAKDLRNVQDFSSDNLRALSVDCF